jgi:hypothetical protein
MRPDREIIDEAESALRIGLPYSSEFIRIIMANGLIILEGTVEWSYVPERSERIVAQLRGVKGVTSLIRLKPPAMPCDISRKVEGRLSNEAHGFTSTRTLADWCRPGITSTSSPM